MNIVRVPFRVSLFGGGTDFKEFYSKKNATVISFTIDRYCYISIKSLLPYSKNNFVISWNRLEQVETIDDIQHPSVKACLKHKKIRDPLWIHTIGDLPARSGVGSSSSFTAALLSALSLYQEKSFTPSSIAKETIFVEQKILKEVVGIQDQIQVCHGGFNITSIFKDSSYSLLSLNSSSSIVNEISDSLILVYSGITRSSSEIQKQKNKSLCAPKLDESLKKINYIAETFASKLTNHTATYDCFESLLKESWAVKLANFPRSETTDLLIKIYDEAISAGANCGKLLGAGGGGFFAFFVNPEKQDEFMSRMSSYVCLRTNISFSGIEKIL